MPTSRRRILLAALPLLLALEVCGQTVATTASPGPSAPAGPAGDVRLEIVGQLSGPSRAVAVRGDHAYVGMGLRLVVVDVADPAQPCEVGDLAVPEGVQGVAVDGDVGYLLLPDGTLRVLDLSMPTAPHPIGAFTAPRHTAQAMAVTGGHVLVVGAEGLQAIDVRDPTAPREASFVAGAGGVDIAVDGGEAYVAASDGLRWFDVKDLTQPRLVAGLPVIGTATAVTAGAGLVAVASWPATQFCPKLPPSRPQQARPMRPAGLTPPLPHASCIDLLDMSQASGPVRLARINVYDQSTNATHIPPAA